MLLTPTFAFLTGLFTVLFVIVCLFLMLVILIQKPRGGGLTGAFGGAGGSASSVFGSKTGDVLTWFTVVCFVLFIALAMALTWSSKPGELGTTIIPPTGPTTDGGTDLPSLPTKDSAEDKFKFDRFKDSKTDGKTDKGTTGPEKTETPAKTDTTPAKDAAPAKTDGKVENKDGK